MALLRKRTSIRTIRESIGQLPRWLLYADQKILNVHSAGMGAHQAMWNMVRVELREFVWLASVVGALSVLGVGSAVVLAMALVHATN